MLFAAISGIAGTALSLYIRATLASPNSDFLDYNYHLYNVIVTGHAFIMIVLYRKKRLLNRVVHILYLYAECLTNDAREVFLDRSMVDASLILKGIEVKWASEPEYKKVFSLDGRIQIISNQKNEPTSYVVTNNENLRITPRNKINCRNRLTIWMALRNIYNISIKPMMFLFIGLAYGVRSNRIGVIRGQNKFIYNKWGTCSNKKIHLYYTTHSNVSTQATDRVQFFSTESASTKEPLKTEVNTVGESKKKEIYTHMTVKRISYSEICYIESLKEGLKRLKGNKSLGVDGLTKADISLERLKKLRKDLITQKYKPKPSKKVPIPKPGGGTRYLGIASAIDKVVQATILNLLTPVVEPLFYENSFGYRPNKVCHDGLKEIKLRWQNVT